MDKSPDDDRFTLSTFTRRGFLATMGNSVLVLGAGKAVSAASGTTGSADVTSADAVVDIALSINKTRYRLLVEPRWTLLYVLREKIGLTGAKEGCGRGECGACTVLIDGIPRYACLTLAVEAQHHRITTVEGLMTGEKLGAVQTAFVEEDAFQCGYCTPGQIMSIEGLLRMTPDPSVDDILTAMSGNLCRCGAYANIAKAARTAARMKKSSTS